MNLLIVTQKIDRNDDVLGFFHRWVEEFAKHCEKITVICLYKGEYDLPKNVKVLSLGKENGASRWKYVRRFYCYIWQERKNYDSVFVHMNQVYVILGGLLWRMWGKAVSLWYAHKSVDLKLCIAEKITHIIFSVSKESFRLSSKKLQIVGHGIDMEQFNILEKKKDPNIFSILTIGRISPAKDYEVLINAIELLKKEGLNFRVDVVGDVGTPEQKEYFERIKNSVSEKGLDRMITFVGSVRHRDIGNYLQKADLFVNMSHTGSVDKAVLEAMASGIVTITCNEAFFTDQFRDILRFQKRDSENLTLKIKHIMSLGSDERSALRSRLRNTAMKDHNLETLITNLINQLNATKTS